MPVQIFEPAQNFLNWFKKLGTGSKNFVLVQKFCTGSEKVVPKAKIELQHIHCTSTTLISTEVNNCFVHVYVTHSKLNDK